MLGSFQQSNLRIEVAADRQTIGDSLLETSKIRKWMWPQSIPSNLPSRLELGLDFSSSLGAIKIEHHVEKIDDNSLQLILSEGIDGYHHWYWGDGWIQSSLEGITLLPLNLGHTLSLLRLRQFLASVNESN